MRNDRNKKKKKAEDGSGGMMGGSGSGGAGTARVVVNEVTAADQELIDKVLEAHRSTVPQPEGNKINGDQVRALYYSHIQNLDRCSIGGWFYHRTKVYTRYFLCGFIVSFNGFCLSCTLPLPQPRPSLGPCPSQCVEPVRF